VRRGQLAFWSLPPALILLQALYTWESRRFLLYEDVAEGIRGPFWLAHRAVFDGISTNVGWYAPLLAAYELFGFSLFAGKWVRLAFYAGAVFAFAFLLARTMGTGWRGGVPLLAAGLSPTLLYFDTLQTSYGLDLQFVAVCGALLVAMRGAGPAPRRGLAFLLGAIAMTAWLAYPVFVFYLPLLAWLLWRATGAVHPQPPGGARPSGRTARVAAAAGFLAPFLLVLLWLRDRWSFLHDPATGSGIFRGGGVGFTLDPVTLGLNLGRLARDVFLRGRSYYFPIDHVELDGLGWATALFVAAAGGVLATRRRELRPLIGLALALGLANLLLVSAGAGPQGIRRATPVIAAFYLVYALVWRALLDPARGELGGTWRRVGIACCLLLPLHHAIAYVGNVRDLPEGYREQAEIWLAAEPGAREGWARWQAWTAAGRLLDCRELGREDCDLSNIYALLAGYRRWNDLPAVPVRAALAGSPVELSVEGWERGELPVEASAARLGTRATASAAVGTPEGGEHQR
jgi:hypothetical protein